jgi:hypothetical protein
LQSLLDPEHAYKALGDLQSRIASAAPAGTDPATIWEATMQLYKLAGGGAQQRAELAATLKLAGLDLKESEGAANRGVRVSEGALNRGVRQSEGAANRAAAGERQSERIGAAGERQDKGIAARKDAATAAEQGRNARFYAGLAQRVQQAANTAKNQARSAYFRSLGQRIQALTAQLNTAPAGSAEQTDALKRLRAAEQEAERAGLPPATAQRPEE